MSSHANPTPVGPGTAKPRVALVFGGRSTEHSVSCVSAGSVLAAIDRNRYDVVPIGISREGQWVLVADDPQRLAIQGEELPEVQGSTASVVFAADPTGSALVVQEPGRIPEEIGAVDVVFPLLHGPYGEDGTIQGLLELAGVPYVGSGVLASAAGMDKSAMKALFRAAGIPVGPYEVITPRQWTAERDATVTRVRDNLELPVFVKPARAGSSMGITKVKSWDDLEAAIEEATRHDPRVLVETGLVAREVECGVLEGLAGERPDVSACAEVRVDPRFDFYDFEAKYLSDSTTFDIPADLSDDVAQRVRELAAQAFEVLGCEGLARVDTFVLDDGTVLLNEVNTMPGFTHMSVFPRTWAATGMTYAELIDRLLQTALRRRAGLR